MIFRYSIVFSIAVLFMAVTFSAKATTPEKEVYMYPFYEEMVDCGGWWIVTEGMIRETFTTFFDKDGEPAKLHIALHVTESYWYNSDHEDIYIQQGSKGVGENASIWIDLVTGKVRNLGAGYRITAPGYGPLLLWVGFYGSDDGGDPWTFHGAFKVPEDGTGSLFCEVLSAE